MRIKIKNASKSDYSFPSLHLSVGGIQWLSDQDISNLAKGGIQIGQLVQSGKLVILATEPDDKETQFINQLIVQAPNGGLWQIVVSNGGGLTASPITAAKPHDNLSL